MQDAILLLTRNYTHPKYACATMHIIQDTHTLAHTCTHTHTTHTCTKCMHTHTHRYHTLVVLIIARIVYMFRFLGRGRGDQTGGSKTIGTVDCRDTGHISPAAWPPQLVYSGNTHMGLRQYAGGLVSCPDLHAQEDTVCMDLGILIGDLASRQAQKHAFSIKSLASPFIINVRDAPYSSAYTCTGSCISYLQLSTCSIVEQSIHRYGQQYFNIISVYNTYFTTSCSVQIRTCMICMGHFRNTQALLHVESQSIQTVTASE